MNFAIEQKKIEEALKKASKEIEPNMPELSIYFAPIKSLHFTTDVMYDYTPKSNKFTSYVLISVALSIMIMASINYMNFSMALIPKRMKNINLRKILGATSASIRWESIFKSAIISVLSFFIGIIIVLFLSKTFIVSFLSVEINILDNMGLILITFILSLFIGIISELYPSFYQTSCKPVLVLKENSAAHAIQLRKILVGIQFLATFTLIMSAWFMYLQNKFMQNANLGYDKDSIVLVDTNDPIRQHKDYFTNQLKSESGIEDVAFASILLSTGEYYNGWNSQYKGESIMFQWIPVSSSFIKTMNIPILEGRGFTEADNGTPWSKYIFNEKAKKEFHLELNALIDSVEIVGFIPDIQYTTFHTVSGPMAFYVPGKTKHNADTYAYIKIKKGSNMKASFEHIKSVLANFESDWPFNVRFYDNLFDQTYKKEKNLISLVSIFSLIAILISIIGILGLVFFEVEYREKEISIRKVIGAKIADILYLINKSFMRTVCVSYILSCPIAYYFVSKWLSNFSNHTSLHWRVFLISGLAVMIITLCAIG